MDLKYHPLRLILYHWASMTEAGNTIVREHPEEFPADLTFNINRVRSEEELAIAAGANASFLGLFKAKAKFKLNKDRQVKSFLVSLVQTLLYPRV